MTEKPKKKLPARLMPITGFRFASETDVTRNKKNCKGTCGSEVMRQCKKDRVKFRGPDCVLSDTP